MQSGKFKIGIAIKFIEIGLLGMVIITAPAIVSAVP